MKDRQTKWKLKQDEFKHKDELEKLRQESLRRINTIRAMLVKIKHNVRIQRFNAGKALHKDDVRMQRKLNKQKLKSKKALKTITEDEEGVLQEWKVLKHGKLHFAERLRELSLRMKKRLNELHGIELRLSRELKYNVLTTQRKLTRTRRDGRHRILTELAKHAKVKLAIRRLKAHMQNVSQWMRLQAKHQASQQSMLRRVVSKATEKLREYSRIRKALQLELRRERARTEHTSARFRRGLRYRRHEEGKQFE